MNVDHDFEPPTSSARTKGHGHRTQSLLKDVDELYLATDGDREGEAIAWHLLETLKAAHSRQADGVPRNHRAAIPRGGRIPVTSTPTWSMHRRRRILDRLYGWAEVSPVLWKKVAPRLSAGRVQSVATRIIVARA